MAEIKKNQNEHLNVEDALDNLNISYQVQKCNYWRGCCCDYYCSRFYHGKTSMLNHVEEKAQVLFSKDREYLNRMLFEQALNETAMVIQVS